MISLIKNGDANGTCKRALAASYRNGIGSSIEIGIRISEYKEAIVLHLPCHEACC